MRRVRGKVICFCLVIVTAAATAGAGERVARKKSKVLVYTKNGQGYVHENIPYAVKCIQRLGNDLGFGVDVSDQPAVFTEGNISQYDALVFPSTNNDVFDTDDQRLVFRRYLEAGGGLVGIHSVVGTERNWKWFKMMLGGTFAWHPKFQKYTVRVIAPEHESTRGLPKVWIRSDECYFMKELYPGIQVLLAQDLTTLGAEDSEKIRSFSAPFAELYPAAWYNHFDGGHVWITALGHDQKDYEDLIFVRHVKQGLTFITGLVDRVDFKRAYAKSAYEPVRY
ncbi:MAG TPA: ThuA domain-containing protein [Blastocatellia bacterium]|nr:ThuA domain-containing protein [Blastocatellia bacterium]